MQTMINEEMIKTEIQNGLLQVDDTFLIDEFNCLFDSKTRTMKVRFTAKNKNDEVIASENVWG